MVDNFKGLTPEQQRLLNEMANKDQVRKQYPEVKQAFKELGIAAMIVGKFVMINIADAKRLLEIINGPAEVVRQDAGKILKLVLNHTSASAEEDDDGTGC